ncbi:MAG: DUF2780 domain-containing protein [Planctomycetaceae bacterium]|nr:DUF2780 domain-containing protein [Planctomycetales bacterium]MCB9927252.1 DUF2780 domain-containing protein [Planctomycetaceae bacterium]
MQEFIQSIAKQLGVDEAVAEKAASIVLSFIKSKLASSDFGSLAAQIPGLSDLAEKGEKAGSGDAGGLLGGMMKMASSAIGGETGDTIELAGKLKESGLDIGQLGTFGTKLLDFIKDKAGDGTVDMILSQLPELKKILGQ